MPSIDLPAQLSSAGVARRFVADQAEGRLDDAAAAVLMASELVTNVVRHTDSEVTVHVDPGPPFRVEVHDGQGATDAFRALVARPGPLDQGSAIGGRGIGLVHALATRFGLDDAPDGGKVVWFEL